MGRLGLSKWDRLEPQTTCADVAEYDEREATVPFEAVFWRCSKDTRVRRRNPLFCEELGIGPLALGVDSLHTLCLGVYQFFTAELVWSLLRVNAWKVQEAHHPPSVVHAMGFDRLKDEYLTWISSESKAGRSPTKIQNFAYSMMGTWDRPMIKIHAAESNTFLRYCDTLMKKYETYLDVEERLHYRLGLDALLVIAEVCTVYEDVVPPLAIQRFTDASLQHIRAVEALEIGLRPKHHFMLHMGPRCGVTIRHKVYLQNACSVLFLSHSGDAQCLTESTQGCESMAALSGLPAGTTRL